VQFEADPLLPRQGESVSLLASHLSLLTSRFSLLTSHSRFSLLISHSRFSLLTSHFLLLASYCSLLTSNSLLLRRRGKGRARARAGRVTQGGTAKACCSKVQQRTLTALQRYGQGLLRQGAQGPG
jgi:hypothetical protein